MDFDPSEFLAMAMTEENNAIFTAPDLNHTLTSGITVEGGLQLEEGLHIPVPMFGGLEDGFCNVDTSAFEPQVEINEDAPTTPMQLSPTERTSSPQSSNKIVTSIEETYFRKDFFTGNYERVRLFRLHCTICDRHLGCAPFFTERQMRKHKLLSVSVCRNCFEFYGDVSFPLDDGSEIFCCWCGQGGELFCCSVCPKTVCKKCIRRNFGESKIKEIDENDNWKCYVCNPADIYSHRALFWGLHRFSRAMRQRVSNMSKEEKMKLLSKDTSHCCASSNTQFQPIKLPLKSLMSKVPICLIAGPHQRAVKNQPDISTPNNSVPSNNNMTLSTNRNLPAMKPGFVTMKPGSITSMVQSHLYHSQTQATRPQASQIAPQASQAGPSRPTHQRGPINRSVPYPMSGRAMMNQRRSLPQSRLHTLPNRSSLPITEVIDLIDSPDKESEELHSKSEDVDFKWLEKGVQDINRTLQTVKIFLNQFSDRKNEMKTDFTKVTTYSDQLSDRIKIAICSLAKINQEIVDNKKSAVDDQVNKVVYNIQASAAVSSTVVSNGASITLNNMPKVVSMPQTPTPVAATRQAVQVEEDANEEMPGLTAALLCETVLEGGGNKENEHGNKHVTKPKPKPTPRRSRPSRKGKSSPLVNTRQKPLKRQSIRNNIPVINLVDDDEKDMSRYCKKYKIKACKVLLTRCC